MEILLEQRFRYANIALLKNYCKLADFQIYKYDQPFDSKRIIQLLDISGLYTKRKNTLFFQDKLDTAKGVETYEYPKFEMAKIHTSLSDKQITRHYNNPFAHLIIHIIERTIKKKGSKIIITSSTYTKERRHNSKYFTNQRSKNILSFDTETGNFIVVNQNTKGKSKGSKIFRTNNFTFLKEVIRSFHVPFKVGENYVDKKVKNEFYKKINENDFLKVIGKLFDIDLFTLDKSDSYNELYNKIIQDFIKLRKIKVPNHSYEHLIELNYPKEKLLKKNDRKLIASVLNLYGIKSKYTIKLLHTFPYLNLVTISKLCLIFGNDYTKYLGSINENVFAISQTKDKKNGGLYYIKNFFIAEIEELYIKDSEKENIVKILNDEQFQKPIDEDFIHDLLDHFKMINRIRFYDENITLKARTRNEFRTEHSQLTKIFLSIKKGWVIEYIFDNRTLQQIEEPITEYIDENTEETFYPLILRREEEYNEEGKFMHHCVATYVDKDKSMIISIRKNNESDRVTCEYDIQTGKLIQSRYFCNASPPEEYLNVIEDITDKVKLLARYGTLNWKEKRKVPVKINGIEVKQEKPTFPDF